MRAVGAGDLRRNAARVPGADALAEKVGNCRSALNPCARRRDRVRDGYAVASSVAALAAPALSAGRR